MDKLLRLKALPVFALFFLIPFAIQFILTNVTGIPASVVELGGRFVNFAGVTLYCAWMYAAMTKLNDRVPEGVTVEASKGILLLPVLYTLWLFIFNLYIFIDQDNSWIINSADLLVKIARIMLWFSLASLFYGMYYMARLLKTVELQKDVTFRAFSGDFFRIWFFPFGIWNIQPRLNKIVAPAPDDMDIFKQDPVPR